MLRPMGDVGGVGAGGGGDRGAEGYLHPTTRQLCFGGCEWRLVWSRFRQGEIGYARVCGEVVGGVFCGVFLITFDHKTSC
jgi:hypothetical protein